MKQYVKRWQWGTVLILASAMASHSACAAVTNPAKGDVTVARMISSPASHGWASVIVKLNGPLDASAQHKLAGLQASISAQLPLIDSIALRVPAKDLARLEALSFVKHVSYDAAVAKTDTFTDTNSGAIAASHNYGVSGKGVTIAVVDSGIDNGSDLTTNGLLASTRIVASVDFTGSTLSGKQTSGGLLGGLLGGVVSSLGNVTGILIPANNTGIDACGHGTHVAGIIAGNGEESSSLGCFKSFTGIAPNADLVSVRVLDGTGQGSVSEVISGLQWVVTNKAKYSIRVINLSLGHPVGESYTTDPLCQAVEACWKAGIVVVCAAGNDGRVGNTVVAGQDNEGYGTAYGSIVSPGNDPYVITVGATKQVDTNRAHDLIATYSSRGPSRIDLVLKPDIIAPGNKITSLEAKNSMLENDYQSTNTVPVSSYTTTNSGAPSKQYFVLSGTSMATPVVSGAVALMLDKDSTLSPDTVKARLMIGADKWVQPDGNGNACTYGAGYLNVNTSIGLKIVATQSALSPALTADSDGNVAINESTIWGSRAVWGTGVADLRAVWGSRAVWGTDSVAADQDILTDNRAVWGTTVDETRAVWGTCNPFVDLTSIAIKGE